ncbi:hypothetical protein HNR48_003126 [Pseudoteredinibacter isoporae]|uniref:Uncharacterized protein n=1 Tax=Pseudoteredinibacter isoporae TaxID=570281 RepID=A0A7X0MWL3_9GAMM|nr:hypothetical protein [Pseudoteredinibacter isoporae]
MYIAERNIFGVRIGLRIARANEDEEGMVARLVAMPDRVGHALNMGGQVLLVTSPMFKSR